MRPNIPLIVTATLALIVCSPASAQLGADGAPILWAADNVEMVDAENIVRLDGRVNVQQGDSRLAADKMDIFLSAPQEGVDRQVERIEADGSVVYVTLTETARGDHGVYTAVDERIRLTGRVRLIRGSDVFCSQELVIRPNLNQFEAVGGSRSNDPQCSGRVRGVISSTGSQTEAPADGSSR